MLEQSKKRVSDLINLSKEFSYDRDALEKLGIQFEELLAFAITGNGDTIYWARRGTPNEWPVVVNDSRAPEWELFPFGISEFLERWLAGTIESKILVSPPEQHAFSVG
jgi:hypothetical protein